MQDFNPERDAVDYWMELEYVVKTRDRLYTDLATAEGQRDEAIAERDALVRVSTVTTEAELNALPEFTVIGAPVRDEDGTIAARVPFLKSPEGTWYSGSEEVTDEELSQLFDEGNPIVLFRPV